MNKNSIKHRDLKREHGKEGFSLIELIVVIAIFGVITSIALFNQGKLNSNILITNLAYEIALAIRETENYGVGVRAASGGGFEGGYGISFDMSTPGTVNLFKAAGNNHYYTSSTEVNSSLVVQNQRGNTITAICVPSTLVGGKCLPANSLSLLNIVYHRPNPEAIFYTKKNAGMGGTITDNDAGPAYIVVNTPSGDNCRIIVVESSGQVRVDPVNSSICK